MMKTAHNILNRWVTLLLGNERFFKLDKRRIEKRRSTDRESDDHARSTSAVAQSR